MFKKIVKIATVGKYYNYSASGDNLEFEKNTIFYANNGYGKTTLTAILKSLSTQNCDYIIGRKTLGKTEAQEVVILKNSGRYAFTGGTWDKKITKKVYIFDNKFIAENIFTDEVTHAHKTTLHKIIIGDKGIEIANKLTEDKTKEKLLKDQKRKFENTDYPSKGYKLTLEEYLKIEEKYKYEELEAKVKEIEDKIVIKSKEVEILKFDKPQKIIIPQFEFNELNKVLLYSIDGTHIKARELVESHISNNIKKQDEADFFLKQGLEHIVGDNCPFCSQDTTGVKTLLDSYKNYFDDSYNKKIFDIKSKFSEFSSFNFENRLSSFLTNYESRLRTIEKWSAYLRDIPILIDVSKTINDKKELILSLVSEIGKDLEEKSKNLDYKPTIVNITSLTETWNEIVMTLEAFNGYIDSINLLIDAFKLSLPTDDIAVLIGHKNYGEKLILAFGDKEKQWRKDYIDNETALNLGIEERTKQENILGDYSKSIFDNHQARINQLLKEFGAEFEMCELSGKTNMRSNESFIEYGIKILNQDITIQGGVDNEPHFKNTLSEGDKSSLAFAFFISLLEHSEDLENSIVIFDDPLSSLDDNRRSKTSKCLSELSGKVSQIIIFTHKKDFLYMLNEIIGSPRVLSIKSDRTNGSQIIPFNVEEDRKHEQYVSIDKLKRYVDYDDGIDTKVIQEEIRLVFERLLKFKYYPLLKGIETLGKMFDEIFKNNLLLDKKDRLIYLCDLSNPVHHGEIITNPFRNLNRDELIIDVQETIILLQNI